MKLLILGGTQFAGRHIAEAALARGHELTLFNRGTTNPDLFPNVEKIAGDRKTPEGLKALAGREWDAVVDTSGYFPGDIRASAELLKGAAGRYLFISTISVYADFTATGMTEDSPLATTTEPDATQVTGDNYGGLKVLCEQALTEIFADRATIVRPGLIVGPYDPTGRFTYWPVRVARGGEVLAPGNPEAVVQFVDARDLAAFALDLIERNTPGIYNATGPALPLTMRALLETSRDASKSDATFTWVSDRFLVDQKVQPAAHLPLWIPEGPEYAGFSTIDCSRAKSQGLAFRPLAETTLDTLTWAKSAAPGQTAIENALSPKREKEILRKWHRLSHPF